MPVEGSGRRGRMLRDDEVGVPREQYARLMKMLEEHERAAWFWASVAVWAKWLTSVVAAIAIIKMGLLELIKTWTLGSVGK